MVPPLAPIARAPNPGQCSVVARRIPVPGQRDWRQRLEIDPLVRKGPVGVGADIAINGHPAVQIGQADRPGNRRGRCDIGGVEQHQRIADRVQPHIAHLLPNRPRGRFCST